MRSASLFSGEFSSEDLIRSSHSPDISWLCSSSLGLDRWQRGANVDLPSLEVGLICGRRAIGM